MSKVARQCILVLAVLLLGALAGLGFVSMQNQAMEEAQAHLKNQMEDFRSREAQALMQVNLLKEQIDDMETVRANLQREVEKFSSVNIDDLQKKVEQLTRERDEWQAQVDTLRSEREELLAKIEKEAEAQVVYKYLDSHGNEGDPARRVEMSPGQETTVMLGFTIDDEMYWAQVLKERAALQLEAERLRSELAQSAIQEAELRKKNTDIQIELARVVNENEAIARQIKHGKDLANSLSLELARSHNDKKFLNDRLVKMTEDNIALQDNIRQLTSTKVALERSIVRLQDEKQDTERRLLETENVIQGRIDEIWQIKQTLDQSFGKDARKGDGQVQLPPIVVSSRNVPAGQEPNIPRASRAQGSIVSVNNENNFVIIDIGQDQGIQLGHNLSVYRGAEYVAGLEIIQVRKDIAAADIISKTEDLQIGDAVR